MALEEKSKIEKVTKKRLIFTPCRGSERNDTKSVTASIFSSSKKPAVQIAYVFIYLITMTRSSHDGLIN